MTTLLNKMTKHKDSSSTLLDIVYKHLSDLESQHFQLLYKSWAQSKFQPSQNAGSKLSTIAQITAKKLDEFQPAHICSIVASIHVLGFTAGDWIAVWSRALWVVPDICFLLEPKLLSKLAFSLASSGHATGAHGKRAFSAIADASMQLVHDFVVQDIAPFAWAFATAGHRADRLFSAFSRKFEANIGDLSPRELGVSAWAYATLGQECPFLFSSLASAAGGRFGSLDPRTHIDTASLLGQVGKTAQKRRNNRFWRKLGLEYGMALPRGGRAQSAVAVSAVFSAFDTDRSGSLSIVELGKALRKLEIDANTDHRIFTKYDVNGDGKIGIAEFRLLVRDLALPAETPEGTDEIKQILPGPQRHRIHQGRMKKEDYDLFIRSELEMGNLKDRSPLSQQRRQRQPADPKIRRTFIKFDTDGSNYLSTHELRRALDFLGLSVDDRATAGVLSRYDENEDGRCNFQEFVQIYNDILCWNENKSGREKK